MKAASPLPLCGLCFLKQVVNKAECKCSYKDY
jgi:hypothetical protein